LPCSGDDPPAKGVSAYSSVLEHGLVLNWDINNAISKMFGTYYQNSFNAFFVVPLSPAWGEGKGLISAHQMADKAIVDMFTNCLNFDLADMLTHIGTNAKLGNRWVNTLTTISLSYPVQDYIDLTKSYLEKLDKLSTLRREKQEIYGGVDATGTGGVRKLLATNRVELEDLYRLWLTNANQDGYDPRKFVEMVRALIYEDNTVENEFNMHMKGVFDSYKTQLDEIYVSVKAVGLDAQEGSVVATIRKLLNELYDITISIPNNLRKFEDRSPEIIEKMPQLLASASKDLTHRQAQLVNDVVSFVVYIKGYVSALRSHIENVRLANKIERFWKDSELTQNREKALDVIGKISRMETDTLLSLISAMHYPITIELNKLDALQTECQRTRIYLTEKENLVSSTCQGIENQIANLETEKKHFGAELRRIWWLKGLLFPGNKKQLKEEINDCNQRIALLSQELDEHKAELLRIQNKKKEYTNIERKFEENSDYRRLILEILRISKESQDKRSDLTKNRGFYERTGELTEGEQLKIMKIVLQGDEQLLTSADNILQTIVDKKNLHEVLVSVINTFRSPEILGLTPDYKTDYMFFTAVAPKGIWTSELAQDVKTALSGYTSGNRGGVDAAVVVREVESNDPWKVRFLLVSGRATSKQLSTFQDMKRSYEFANDTQMSHSYLIEQGIRVENDDLSYIKNILGIKD
jgi:hypothetical protein